MHMYILNNTCPSKRTQKMCVNGEVRIKESNRVSLCTHGMHGVLGRMYQLTRCSQIHPRAKGRFECLRSIKTIQPSIFWRGYRFSRFTGSSASYRGGASLITVCSSSARRPKPRLCVTGPLLRGFAPSSRGPLTACVCLFPGDTGDVTPPYAGPGGIGLGIVLRGLRPLDGPEEEVRMEEWLWG